MRMSPSALYMKFLPRWLARFIALQWLLAFQSNVVHPDLLDPVRPSGRPSAFIEVCTPNLLDLPNLTFFCCYSIVIVVQICLCT